MCLRFQIAAVYSAGADFWPVLALLAGGFTLGFWNPWAAIFSFTVFVPLLNGLNQDGFVIVAFLPSLVFSALWTAIMAKRLFQGSAMCLFTPIIGKMNWPSSFVQDAKNGINVKVSEVVDHLKITKLRYPANCSRFPSAVNDVLTTAVFLSLAWQLWRQRGSAELWSVIFQRTVPGYGDPFYFLSSAFLWLQGLFFFRFLHPRPTARNDPRMTRDFMPLAVETWVRPTIIVYGISMVFFFLIQLFLHIPERWTGAGFQAPYEDINSFGGIGVTAFIFIIASWSAAPQRALAVSILSGACFLFLVMASWSRAAWLAGSVFLLLVAVFRFPRALTVSLVLVLVALVVGINAQAKRPFLRDHLYLARLVTLVRLENPINKSVERVYLYKKAARMIHEYPVVGHGIGTFYLESVNYSQDGDPYAAKPDFAHNVFLQIAVEEGVPIAALFAGFIAWTLWRAFVTWLELKAKGPQCKAHALLLLGTALALGTYLQTQMTANSLNVYASNQFFFWFLMAAILRVSKVDKDRVPDAQTMTLPL